MTIVNYDTPSYFKNGEGSFPFYYFSIKEIMYNFAIVILLNNGIKTNFYL